MKTFITNPVFRWIAVLPGAILASFAATFPWHWFVLFFTNFVGWFEGEETLGLGRLVRTVGAETVERLGYGFITPFVMIVIAAKIAPRYKVATGRVVGLLLVALFIIATFTVPEYSPVGYFQAASGLDKLYPVALAVIWVAAIYTAFRFNKNRSTD